MPEHSYGVNRVTLILRDGTEVHDVYIGWAIDILRIGASKEVAFDTNQILDVRHQQ